MSTEIATRSQSLAQREELGIEDVIAQVQKIQAVMAQVMKEGEHFGVIPGTNKPTLLKPGAEKLLLTFRFDPQYESAETYDGKHLTVKSRCTLYHITSGQRMGSGEGSCSTKESKYAYRQGKRLCPKCGADAILRSKFPPKTNKNAEPGWYCYSKRGGCGEEFLVDDVAITGQTTARVANEDLPDQYNTVLKMANKRSLIAAVLNVTAASDIFTQDLEDTDVGGRGGIDPNPQTMARDGSPEPRTEGATGQRGNIAPADPDAPALVAEAASLFPTPEDDERAALIKRVQAAGGKLSKQQRGKLKEVWLGDAEADIFKADIAALEALARHLEAPKA